MDNRMPFELSAQLERCIAEGKELVRDAVAAYTAVRNDDRLRPLAFAQVISCYRLFQHVQAKVECIRLLVAEQGAGTELKEGGK